MISRLLGTFDLALALEFAFQVLLALALGGVIGLERERRRMPAGIRTFMLVTVGSCMFTILSYRAFVGGDPSRIAAGIVSGIGFLGAGVTIHRKGTIHGLTSAAGVWAMAAVGMAVGTGNYFLAILCTAAILVVMGLLRRFFKADVARTTRRTLRTALRQARSQIATMGDRVECAVRDAIEAVLIDDHNLAREVIHGDEWINALRYQVEEATLQILQTQAPGKIQLRTVLAATHVVTNLERIGDYAKEIAQIRLKIGHEPMPLPPDRSQALTDQVCTMLHQVLAAFANDDVDVAQRIAAQTSTVTQQYQELVEAINDRMGRQDSDNFELGVLAMDIAYYLRRIGERVNNIAERIVFVRTGALRELDRGA